MAFTASAQREQTVFGKSGLRLTGAWGGPATNITKMGDEFAYLSGGFGGLEFNNSVFLGWGGYSLIDEEGLETPFNQLEMNYRGPMIGYSPRANKVIHPTFMLMFGPGRLEMDGESDTDKIFVLQPSAGFGVNVFRWFHIELEGGYRIVTDTDLDAFSDSDLSNLYAGVRFKFGWSWGR